MKKIIIASFACGFVFTMSSFHGGNSGSGASAADVEFCSKGSAGTCAKKVGSVGWTCVDESAVKDCSGSYTKDISAS